MTQQKLKIIHLGIGVVPVPPPTDRAAGTEELIYLLTRTLNRLGCDVEVIDIKEGTKESTKRRQSGVTYYQIWRLPLPSRYSLPFLQRWVYFTLVTLQMLFFAILASLVLFRRIRHHDVMIIHTHNSHIALAAAIVNRLRGKRAVTVYTMHSAYGLQRFSWLKRFAYFAEVPALRASDHVIALTPSVKRWLQSEFRLAPSKISQIYNGIDIEEASQTLRQDSGGLNGPIVLCVGVIAERKNQMTAVKAFSMMAAGHPTASLVFVGRIAQPSYFRSIQQYCREQGLLHRIHFKGEVPKPDLYTLYRSASLFLFPTVAEVDPLVLKEALVFGLPVVASRIEPVVDMLRPVPDSGILVDPYDVPGFAAAMSRVIEDVPLQESMRMMAKQLSSTVTIDHVGAQTLALYETLSKKRWS